MRVKYLLIGLIVGVAMTISFSAIADGVSKIGKKIDAEYVVKLDGAELDVKAISMEGTSYAPVRAIGEALGLDVDFVEGEVLLNKQLNMKLNTNKVLGFHEMDEEMLEFSKETQEYVIERNEALIDGWERYYPDGIPAERIERYEEMKQEVIEAKQNLIEIQDALNKIENEQ